MNFILLGQDQTTYYRAKNSRFLIENLSRKVREKSGFGVWGVLGAMFVVNVKKRVARKLRRIILLHSEIVTCRIHFQLNFLHFLQI